ncbi:hypothetical protein GOBAR_DD05140 [Gossypium barbadense]|nr:hypothetical protein GOBAR_DD05140 [Gossypium barbadense]
MRRFNVGVPNHLVSIGINEGFDGGLNQVRPYGVGGVEAYVEGALEAPSRVTTRGLEWLYLGWVPKVFYMWFGSKVKVPEPVDSSIFTHYRLIQAEFGSGKYISLWLHGDEDIMKT